MAFSNTLLGWENIRVISIVDAFSRYCQFYPIKSPTAKLIESLMKDFISKFQSVGQFWKVNLILSDAGTENSRLKNIAKHHVSRVGAPVLYVESLHAEFFRKASIFRTAELTENVSILCSDIAHQINNQEIENKGNFTPVEILRLPEFDLKKISKKHSYIQSKEHQHPLFNGDTVRTLLWTEKDQLEGKKKGYGLKWSYKTYEISKKARLPNNQFQYRYWVKGVRKFFYRHELQKIEFEVDNKIPSKLGNKIKKRIDKTIYTDSFK